MLLIGIITILLYSSYNEIYKTELKRIYQISGIIILYTIIILYNSINIIYIGKSLILFNDIINITSYTIYIKILILILTIIYILINNEYINITINNNIGDKLNKNISYNSNFIILLLFNILGILLLIESYNLILIYIAIELQSYSIYIITSKYISSIKDHSYNTSKWGLIYFLFGCLGSIIILIGLNILYQNTGLINIYNINIYISINNIINNNLILGYILIFIGLIFKIGIAPFHNWLINIYVNVPTIITLWISIITKISILTLIYNLIYNNSIIYNNYNNYIYIFNNYLDLNLSIIYILNIISIFSMIIGSLGGLSQINIKRIIAYSGLANSGYLLYAIISNNQLSLQSYIFYLSQYSLTHFNWFLILIISIIYNFIYYNNYNNNNNNNNNSNNYLPNYYKLFGFMNINPYITFCYIITLSSLIGIPPLIGFFGKYYIIISGLYSGYIFTTIILIIVSVITTYYYIYIIYILINRNRNNIINNYNIINIGNKSNIIILSYMICYIISIITIIIISPLLLLDIYINGSNILDYYQYTI